MAEFARLGMQVTAIGWDYDATGESFGTIPDDHQVQVSWPRGDVPTMRITISEDAVRSAKATTVGSLLLVEVAQDQGAWVEPHDSRFIVTGARWNRVDGRRVYEVDAVGARWLLAGAIISDAVGKVTPEGYRSWPTSNASQIISQVLFQAKQRKSLNGLTWFSALQWGFTDAKDSSGLAWTTANPITLPPNESVAYALEKIADYGLAEWELRGWTLYMVAAGRLTRDLTTGDQAVLLRDSQVVDAPERASIADLCTDVHFTGDEGFVQDFAASSPWPTLGRFERSQSQGAVSSIATASIHADRLLVPGRAPRMEYTRDALNGDSPYLPWIHVRDGDKVLIESDGSTVAVDVAGISITRSASELRWAYTLGDRIEGLLTRLNRRADLAMLGAGVKNGDGTPVIVSPPPNPNAPAAVGALATNSSTREGPWGIPIGLTEIVWQEVTADTKGDPITVDHYEVGCFQVGNAAYLPDIYGIFAWPKEGHAFHDGLTPGWMWRYKVRAVSKDGVVGAWSPIATQVVASDTTPPPVPSKPTATSALGANTVTWDGKGVVGGASTAMPSDFSYIKILESTVSADGTTVSAPVVIGTLDRSKTSDVFARSAAQKYRYSLIAVDASKNESAASATTDVVTASALDDPRIKSAMDTLDADLDAAAAVAAQAVKDAAAAKAVGDAAKIVGDQAKATGDQAVKDAAAAKAVGDNALAVGNQAKTTADKAVSDAAAAKAAGDNALSVGNAAQSAANQAKTTADKAVSDAAAAKAVGDQAKLDAASAKTAADAAKATGDKAVLDAAKVSTDLDVVEAILPSKADTSYVQSRGTDLVTNGTGFLGSNYNFQNTDFTARDAPTGASGSFVSRAGATNLNNDEQIPVDPTKAYRFSFSLRQTGTATNARGYSGYEAFDADGFGIRPYHYLYDSNTLTTLTAPLNVGDTLVKVNSTAGWDNGATAAYKWFQAWFYVDGKGRVWEPRTYTRDSVAYAEVVDATTVRLSAPWSRRPLGVGATVSNGFSGGTYIYCGMPNNSAAPTTWASYSAILRGTYDGNTRAVSTGPFPPGTSTIRLIWLMNRNVSTGAYETDSRFAYGGISLSDAAAAQQDASAALAAAATAQTTANTAVTSANGKNRITYASTAAPANYVGTSGDTWFQRDATGVVSVVSEWNGTNWAPRTLNHQTISSIDAGKITVGTLDVANRISAQSMTVDKLLIGSSENLIPNGAGEYNTGGGIWNSAQTSWVVDAASPSGAGYFRCPAGTRTTYGAGVETADASMLPSTPQWQMEPNAEYYYELWIRADKPNSRLYIEVRNQAFNQAGFCYAIPGEESGHAVGTDNPGTYWLTNKIVPTTWTKISGIVKANADTTSAYLRAIMYNYSSGTERNAQVDIAGFRLQKRATGRLIVDGSISARQIAAESITADRIAANSLTAAQIKAQSIGATEIAANAIVAGLIATDAVVAGKIAANAITAREIVAGSITAAEIKSGSITGDRIAANTITAGQIAGGTITAAEIKAATITGDKLVMNSISTRELAAGAVTANEIAANTITAAQIKAAAITTAEIAAGTILASNIKAGTITGDRLLANTITAAQIAGNTITAAQIAGNTITAAQIAGGTITAAEIKGASITAAEIKGASITGDKLAFFAITGERIAGDAITAQHIAAGTITAYEIKAGTITGDRIAANAIGAREIFGGSITADKIAGGAITGEKISATAFEGYSFTGGTFTGGTFRTSATNPKIELTGTGNALLGWYASGRAALRLDHNALAFWKDDGQASFRINAPTEHQRSVTVWSDWGMIVGTFAIDWEGYYAGDQWRIQNSRWDVTPTSYLQGWLNNNHPITGFMPTLYGAPGIELGAVPVVGGGFYASLRIDSDGARATRYFYLDFTPGTTASNYLVRDNANGQVKATASMGWLKLDQEIVTLDDALPILDITPKTWRDRGQVQADPDTTERYAGAVAEDLIALAAEHPSLLPLVTDVGVVEGIQSYGIAYDRITAYLIPIIKDLRERVATLEGAT